MVKCHEQPSEGFLRREAMKKSLANWIVWGGIFLSLSFTAGCGENRIKIEFESSQSQKARLVTKIGGKIGHQNRSR